MKILETTFKNANNFYSNIKKIVTFIQHLFLNHITKNNNR